MNNEELLIACKESKEFFLENFYYIPIVGKGAELFELYDHQKVILQKIDEQPLNIGLKARQIGWTTIGVANAVQDVLFNDEHPWLFVSRTEDAAIKMLQKARYSWNKLPGWMKRALPKLVNNTQTAMEWANGSRIESVPATGSTGRGDSVYGALMDEVAFMEYAEEIWGAIEPLVYGPAMLFSTANGMGNFFHEVWLDSQTEGSVWTGTFYPWNVVAKRDTGWYEHTKAAYRGREWLFFQEYPATPEEAFAKSGRVAFQSDPLSKVYEPMEHTLYNWVIGDGAYEVPADADVDIPIKVWKEPEVLRDGNGRPLFSPNYVIGVDTAEGLEHGDFTYASVFDANTGEQVAASKSSIPVSYLSDMLDWLGRWYMNALIVVERNNTGLLPLDRLYRDFWYPRLYRMDLIAEMRTGDRTPRYGWRTDKATKPKMVNDFVHAILETDVLLHDYDFMVEANTFVADGKGSFSATANNHDDVIMGTLVAWQGVLDSPKYPIIWRDTKVLPATHEEMDAAFWPDRRDDNAHFLETPIGQKPVIPIRKTVILLPENFNTDRNNT